jgi:hypothetical protein
VLLVALPWVTGLVTGASLDEILGPALLTGALGVLCFWDAPKSVVAELDRIVLRHLLYRKAIPDGEIDRFEARVTPLTPLVGFVVLKDGTSRRLPGIRSAFKREASPEDVRADIDALNAYLLRARRRHDAQAEA